MQWDVNYSLWIFATPLLIIAFVVMFQAFRSDRIERPRSSKSHPAE
jgi:hypothetical protein